MHSLAQKVLDYVRRQELLTPGDRVGVAVSGGADSVALLRLLRELRAELGIVLAVVHLNHKLRGEESDRDEEFVRDLARTQQLEFYTREADVEWRAAEEHISIEAAARELRYGFFEDILGASPTVGMPLDKVATGHTMDDQAETVLMRVIRGTGMRGLRSIQPRIPVEDETGQLSGEIIRPLLRVRRHEVEQYLGAISQPWREDSTNAEPKFTRNRVRHVLMPLLEGEFNPGVVEGLAELAEIARQEEDYWDGEAAGWLGTAVQWSEPEWARGVYANPVPDSLVQIGAKPMLPDEKTIQRLQEPGPAATNASISRGWFLSEPIAVQRRVIKAVAETVGLPLEFKHVEAVLRFAAEENGAGKGLDLPLGWCVQRERDALVFVTPDLRAQERVRDYEYQLRVPGRTVVPEIYAAIEAVRVNGNEQAGCNPDELFDPALLADPLTVRNWRPGDRFWPAHTKAAKKIKELLQEKHLPEYRRRSWPVVVSGGEIIWVLGFAGREQYRPAEGTDAVQIRAVPLNPEVST